MVDFTAHQRVPIEEIIALGKRQGEVPSAASSILGGVTRGIEHGVALSEQIGDFARRRQRAAQIAKAMTLSGDEQTDALIGATALDNPGQAAQLRIAQKQYGPEEIFTRHDDGTVTKNASGETVTAVPKNSKVVESSDYVDMPVYRKTTDNKIVPATTVDETGNQVPLTEKRKKGLAPRIIYDAETPPQKEARLVDQATKIDGVKKLNTFAQNGLPAFEKIDGIMASISTGKGAWGRFKGITEEQLAKLAKDDPSAATAYAWVQGTPAQFAKMMGDVGNLSLPEQENAKNLVPKLSDPDDVKALKSVAMYSFAKSKITTMIETSGLSGENYKPILAKLDKNISRAVTRAKAMGIPDAQIQPFTNVDDAGNLPFGPAKQAQQDPSQLKPGDQFMGGTFVGWE